MGNTVSQRINCYKWYAFRLAELLFTLVADWSIPRWE